METPSISICTITAGHDSRYAFLGDGEGQENFDENTTPFESFNPGPSDHPYEDLFANSENGWSQPAYTENCPYRIGEIRDNAFVAYKKFRLVEELPNGLVYTGDSYGSHSYIDANEERACPQSCLCWSHNKAPRNFTFIAQKSSSGLVVDIYSNALYSEIMNIMGPKKTAEIKNMDPDNPLHLNGFYLLQSFPNLLARLNLLRCCATLDQALSSVVSDMELLVHGFLADGEVFRSFGYEHLYENGFINFEQWKAFQQDQLQRDISVLDERVTATRDFKDFEEHFGSQDFEPLLHMLLEDFEATETQLGGNSLEPPKPGQNCVDRVNIPENTQCLESSNALKLSNSEDLSTCHGVTSSHNLSSKGTDPVESQNVSPENFLWSQVQLLHAIHDGNEKYVSDILDQGAAVNGIVWAAAFIPIPLLAAARSGQEGIVRLLLNRGALDVELALIMAAGAGYAAIVSLLLAHHRAKIDNLNQTFWYFDTKYDGRNCSFILQKSESQSGEELGFYRNYRDSPIIGMNSSWPEHLINYYFREISGLAANDMALFEAATAGHEEVVRILLDSGAEPKGIDILCEKNNEWSADHRIPVVEAAKAGHGSVMLLLLQRGAAISSLQPLMSPPITTEEDSTFRCLNKRFIQQYQLMTETVLSSSGTSLELGLRFKNYKEAWRAGISTMRRLCNGRPPRGIQNSFAFLCISRAMAETLDSINSSDYTSQFIEDLERWQIIFASKELDVYRQWIQSMWGISLSENKAKAWKTSDFLTLTHFQTLLSTLIRQANEPVNLYGPQDQSLLCSQQRFLARNHQISAEPKIDPPTADSGSSDRSNPNSLDDIEPKPPDIPIVPETIPLKKRIKDDISAASLNTTVVVLLAGAIFAIIIIFFQSLRKLSTGFSYDAEIYNLQDRCQVLTAYLSLKVDFAIPSISPRTSAIYNSSLSNSSSGIATPSSDSNQQSPNTQHLNQNSKKLPQKSRRTCPTCKKKILATNLKRHLKDHSGENRVNCSLCGKSVGRKEYLQRHERERCPLRYMIGRN